MNVTQQYAHLVEIVANARVLAACSDNSNVIRMAEEVKLLGSDAAGDLGATKTNFDRDTVARYMKLVGRE